MNRNIEIKKDRTEISRRGFLGDLIGYAALASFIPIVPMAISVGKYNQHIVREAFFGDKLSDRLQDVQDEINIKMAKNECQEAIKRSEDGLRRKELEEPGNFSFDDSTNRLILAKAIFCEGEEVYQHNNYMKYVGFTPVVRAILSNKSIKEVISQKGVNVNGVNYAYSFFNPANPRKAVFDNPLLYANKHPKKNDAWQKAYETAEEILKLTPEQINPELTHFYVDSIEAPSWTIGRKPKETIKYNGKTTRFFYIPEHFKTKS